MRKLEQLIRDQDWIYDNAGTCWQDGLIIGNGDLGVVAYAPYQLEWVLNKGDIFDGRIAHGDLLPHHEVMRRFHAENHKTLGFLDAVEGGGTPPVSKSAATLRLRYRDETAWGAPRPHQVKQRLCLWEGELYEDADMVMSHPRLRSLVPRDRNVLCIRLEHSGAVNWGHLLELCRPMDDDLQPPTWAGGEGLMSFTQQMTHGAIYAVAVKAVPTKGPDADDLFNQAVLERVRPKASAVGHAKCRVHHGQLPLNGNADIYVAVTTSYEHDDPRAAAIALVEEAARTGFDKLEAANQQWWRDFWARGWADFGDHHEIQRYWTFSLYETACLLNRAPVGGLYGLWYGPMDTFTNGIVAAWYCHDQNVQMPMMPIFPLNRPELVIPFADTYLNTIETLKAHTRQVHEKDGAMLPLTMNQLGQEVTGGCYRYSVMGGAYSGVILAWAWRYTRDLELMRDKLYPLLRELLRFHADCFAKDDAGRYYLDWEIPPEIGTLSRNSGPTLGLIQACLETAVEVSELLACDDEERAHWQDILDHYPDYPMHPDGSWWAGDDVVAEHCLQSAYLLYPFFPAEVGDAETAAVTLEQGQRWDVERTYADTDGRWHYKRSWSWFFPAMVKLRTGQRETGWHALHDCLRCYSKTNGLFTHNSIVEAEPGEIEANLRHIPAGEMVQADGVKAPLSEFWAPYANGTANPNVRRLVTCASEGSGAFLLAATETLLQSHGGLIRLFPCVPEDFTGRFETFLAQGNIEVSATMENGEVTECRLKARHDTIAKLQAPEQTVLELPPGAHVDAHRILHIPLTAGATVNLHVLAAGH